jgi:hypothetical protein
MKNLTYISLVILLIASISCKEDKNFLLPEEIIAGQKTGNGINYFDFEPDLACYVANPWEKQDTSFSLDLNKDGVNDFIFKRHKSHPGMLGMGSDEMKIVSLGNNAICISPYHDPDTVMGMCQHSALYWVDTIPVSDTINDKLLWTHEISLIYYNLWVIQQCYLTDGLWRNVVTPHEKYIGFRIVANENKYYGWIGMNRYAANDSYLITDYAIATEYEE